jgi:replicative DNA helicase
VSCEDPDQVWGARLLGALADVDTRKFLHAQPSEYDAGRCVRAFTQAKERGLHFSFQIGKPVPKITAAIKRLVERDGCNVIYVDYLQAIAAKGQDRYVARTDALQELKGLCYDLRVPLVMGSQLKRPENGNPFREPNSTDLKDSGDIENMSEAILLLWPKSDDQGAPVFGKVSKVKWSDARPRFQILRSQTNGSIVDLIDAPKDSNGDAGTASWRKQ